MCIRDREKYVNNIVDAFGDKPILIDKFLNDAVEVDVDALSDGKNVFIAGIMEHIEEAGIHSGDSACSLPPYSLSENIIKKIIRQTKLIAKKLETEEIKGIDCLLYTSPSPRDRG